jgi:hypothetical protein
MQQDNGQRAASIIDALVEHGRAVILKEFQLNSCIATAAIAMTVLEKFGIAANPLSVQATIYNAPCLKRLRGGESIPASRAELLAWHQQDGAWMIGVGMGEAQPGMWPGHLGVVAEGATYIDLAIDQVRSKTGKVYMKPLRCPVNPQFLAGEKDLCLSNEKVGVVYTALPQDRSYEVSPYWCHEKHRQAKSRVASRIVSMLRRVLDQ